MTPVDLPLNGIAKTFLDREFLNRPTIVNNFYKNTDSIYFLFYKNCKSYILPKQFIDNNDEIDDLL